MFCGVDFRAMRGLRGGPGFGQHGGGLGGVVQHCVRGPAGGAWGVQLEGRRFWLRGSCVGLQRPGGGRRGWASTARLVRRSSVAFRRRGSIGNLTSQFFANVHLDRFDHFVTEALGAPYVRYVDDFALFADDPVRLEWWRGRLEAFLARRRLSLHPAKTHVARTASPATFLGFELRPGGGVGCPRRTCGASATACAASATAGGRARSRGGKWNSGWAPGWRTRRTPTRSGCAARSSGAGGSRRAGNRSRGPDRPPAVVWCAAAPGTTMPRTSVPARATGTPPPTGTTTTVFEFRARPVAGAAAATAASRERGSVQGRS